MVSMIKCIFQFLNSMNVKGSSKHEQAHHNI